MSRDFTVAEAAFVLNERLDVLRKELERGPVKWRIMKRGDQKMHAFAENDLIFLYADREFRKTFTVEARRRFHKALVHYSPSQTSSEIEFDHLKLDVREHLAAVEAKLRHLDALSTQISIIDGVAFLKGTQIEAHRIAALTDGGMSHELIQHDYPSLTVQQIDDAILYARINPKVGRPYPGRTAKSAMRGSGLDALDAK